MTKINDFKENLIIREVRGKQVPYLKCNVRNKEIKLTPEEVVRQLYIIVLHEDFG